MTTEEMDFLVGLSQSIISQLELQQKLIERLMGEDRYLSLQEVKERIPGITTGRLNALARAGKLKTRELSPRRHEYLESSLAELFPRRFGRGTPPKGSSTPIQE